MTRRTWRRVYVRASQARDQPFSASHECIIMPETRAQPSRWVTIDTRERICVRSSWPRGRKVFFSKNHSRYVCHFAPTFDAFYSPYTPLFLCIDACVCVSSPPPFPATFQSFLPCGEKKVGGGKAIAWGWQRGNYYLDGYDDDDGGGGERNRVVVSCLCWSFLQGESNSSIRMAVYVRYSVE